AAEQSAAESAAAESMERRAGTKGNASQQSTCRAQSRISVSQAPDRMRQLLAVWTRGGSRMRESRTYGSVRGACDETHVPTATCASRKLVRSSRWKSGPSKGQRPLGSECCVPTGDSGHEAYTAIAWGVGLSHERSDIAGAESFHSLE